jgi:hypothetical protein
MSTSPTTLPGTPDDNLHQACTPESIAILRLIARPIPGRDSSKSSGWLRRVDCYGGDPGSNLVRGLQVWNKVSCIVTS